MKGKRGSRVGDRKTPNFSSAWRGEDEGKGSGDIYVTLGPKDLLYPPLFLSVGGGTDSSRVKYKDDADIDLNV